jgi:8-oxo-dGTP pyrophosphatase MutT (NUDIX family)
VASHGNAVAGLPYDAERGCALTVRLLRAPVLLATGQDWLEEACAGMIDDGEAAHTSMGREAREELGLECGAVEAIGTVWSIPGVSEHEGITVVERSLRSLLADADAGNITDGKLLTLVLALRRRHAHVFEPR